jgi:hypothetical protein
MALQGRFSRGTPLQLALDRGTRPGAKLGDELGQLSDYSIKSQSDAESVCRVLGRRVREDASLGGHSSLHALIGLFQDVEGCDCPAFATMVEVGIPLLTEIVDAGCLEESGIDPDDVLFALKILVIYGTVEGTDAVIRVAKRPFQPDSYWWHLVLGPYGDGHPESERLFQALSDPLPVDFLAVSLIDSANAAQKHGAEQLHPFDSRAGKRQIERWLVDHDPEHLSYAMSATAALPFISNPGRDRLLAIALDHPGNEVKLEAAFAAARLGREGGIERLAQFCLDVHCSEKGRSYLVELGREDAIPAEALAPDFRAQAELSQWLAHPNELGRVPDELEVMEKRTLAWPPERESKMLWLIRYRLRDQTGLKDDDVGIGLVGSVTFCLSGSDMERRPPEDCYAIHCYWELEARGVITEAEVEDGSTEYDGMLRQIAPGEPSPARIIRVVELAPELKYPQRLIGLGRVARDGANGWTVFDGPRSRWYDAALMPEAGSDKQVLMIHVGRVLLGFEGEPDRRQFLQQPAQTRSAQEIIASFERLLNEARTSTRRTRELLGSNSPLGAAFAVHAAALQSVRLQSHAQSVADTYELLLSAATQAEPSLHDELFDAFSALGENFTRYVDSLIELHRQAEVPALIARLRPSWDHNLGYGKLGTAAFKSSHDALAEPFFVQLRQTSEDWCRHEEMSFLAEIWHRQGRIFESRALLLDAMRGLFEQCRTAIAGDRKLCEYRFQFHRSTFLRIFPDRGEAELRRMKIPSSTLAGRS